MAGNGPYTWASTPALITDVQGWLDTPANNFGWVIVGNEAAQTTAKRFATRENIVLAERPQLIFDFQPLAASVTSTGTGCIGSSTQALVLGSSGLPTVPSPTFAWTATGAPAGAAVVNALGLGLLNPSFPLTPNCSL